MTWGFWCTVELGAIAGFQVIGPHDPSHTMLATRFTCFAQIEKDTRGPIDAMARRIRRANQAEQPLILYRSIGKRVP